MNDKVEIQELLYRVVDCLDRGKPEEMGAFFTHATVFITPGMPPLNGAADMVDFYHKVIKVHSDGTPRSRHMVINPIIDIADDGQSATCRSMYTMVQQTETLPLQVVAAGRYYDRFEKSAGAWRFTERRYEMDMSGNVSEHVHPF